MEVRPGYKQTEVGVIPVDWRCQPLNDLTDPMRPIGYGIVQTGRIVRNGVKCVRVVDMIAGHIDPELLITTSEEISSAYKRTLLRENDVVIALRGKIGAVAVIQPNLAGSNLTRGVALLSNSGHFDSVYLSQYLSSATGKSAIERNLNGSALQEIPIAALRKLPAVVPPLPEQRAIATALSDVDALLAKLDALVAKKRDLKQAAMQQLLTGQTRLPGFSGEWEVKRLGEVAVPRKDRIDPRKAGVQEFCIELEHIEQGTGCLAGSGSTGEESSLKSVFHAEDVLFGKLRAYLRKYWLADRSGVCSTEIWVLVANRNLVAPVFLFQVVTLDSFIETASTAYGTHMPRSDWNVVKNYEVAIPTLEEQIAIAAVLSDMDAELAALEARRDKTRALKQGMMQELLTGSIRLI